MAEPADLAALHDAHAPALHAYLLNLTRCEADIRRWQAGTEGK